MPTESDEIASIVLDEFRKLPAKRQPCVRDNGLHEWVPLSGIVAKGPGWIRCVALATGMKCLPASKLPQANGTAIHDWHAEVLAIRAFNYFVLEECKRLSLGDDASTKSDFIRRKIDNGLEEHPHEDPGHGQPFAWREEVSLHMYCSEAPCGDASMELIMAAQDDASPWDLPPPVPLPDNDVQDTPTPAQTNPAGTENADSLLGRGYFSQLGIVRRKPSRGDAPPSLSKSCSDKLALKQCTSLLSSLSSLFVSPSSAYLTSIILPESQYSPAGCHRCFSEEGRMKPLLPYLHTSSTPNAENTATSEPWRKSGYAFTPFEIRTTTLEFDFSKRTASAKAAAAARQSKEGGTTSGSKIVASNLAVACTANGLNEGIVGGVLQGRKKFDLKGASAVSRRKTWILAAQVAKCLAAGENNKGGEGGTEANSLAYSLLPNQDATYDHIKECSLLNGRKAVKQEARREALKGWVRNIGDGGFRLSDQ